MKPQLREKNGRFLKINMNRQDWEKLLAERWSDIENLKAELSCEKRAYNTIYDAMKNLELTCGSYANALNRAETKLRKQKIMSRIWISVAFILGTIFFMVLTKSIQ